MLGGLGGNDVLTMHVVDKAFANASVQKPKPTREDSCETSSMKSDSTSFSMKNSWRSSLSSLNSVEHVDPPKHSKNICLDVKHFEPGEMSFKIENDNTLVVQGSHEEINESHGVVSRRFTKRVIIPDDYDRENISFQSLKDGILIITIPKKGLVKQRSLSDSATSPIKEQPEEPQKPQTESKKKSPFSLSGLGSKLKFGKQGSASNSPKSSPSQTSKKDSLSAERSAEHSSPSKRAVNRSSVTDPAEEHSSPTKKNKMSVFDIVD